MYNSFMSQQTVPTLNMGSYKSKTNTAHQPKPFFVSKPWHPSDARMKVNSHAMCVCGGAYGFERRSHPKIEWGRIRKLLQMSFWKR